ncbi:UNVERIFIED_CONTAM: hypothetical protein GTU68_045041 [Idotea baltica]|nr:hypothetical protein [Idotea baltica]
MAQKNDGKSTEKSGHAAHKKYPANRLAGESSPYLLLHAHNPVDWYPWGDEAFAKAKKDNKPIFLSVGYSSCYWCHVMERLVFSNPKIAEYMNSHFVNVKVDREERPDVDDIYMTSLIVYFQAIQSPQGGGWPLSMFLTPDGKPFAGGTYFPPDDSGGRSGFDSVSKRVFTLWSNNEKELRANSELITSEVRRMMKPQFVPQQTQLDKSLVSLVTTTVKGSYDSQYGGIDFNSANPDSAKFPVPAKLAILDHAAKHGDKQAASILGDTLDKIARGGIQDHLAGGFHRYSTDRRWHVPHFEKMLYDQSQLASLYTDAWKQNPRDDFRRAAEGILDYVLRDFTGPEGGFYSALDAETNAIEGEYYVWSQQEVKRILGKDADVFMTAFGMKQPNSFEHGYVLHQPKNIEAIAADLKTTPEELLTKLGSLKAAILKVRDKREAPLKDDKVVTSWNGLMIKAYAKAGSAFERKDYTDAAIKAADFVLTQLRDKDGRLMRTWRGGSAKLKAYLDDYAFVIAGLLELHHQTSDQKWLDAAIELSELQHKHYWSREGKGYFFTADDHEALIARTRSGYDNVMPSGNGYAARNLLQLASITGEQKYGQWAKETLQAFAPVIQRSPGSMTTMAIALAESLEPPKATRQPTALPPATLEPAAPATPQPAKQKKTAEDEQSPKKTTLLQPVEMAEHNLTFVSFQDGSTQQKPAAKKKKPKYVNAKAYLSVDKLPAGKACRIVMVVDVTKGWHINSNPASPEFLEPTRLVIKSKHGTKLTRIRYPKPQKLVQDGDEIHVYEGKLEIHGLIEIPASAAGKTEQMEIVLEYQACDSRRCLRPMKVTLGGKVPVAESVDQVKLINLALFPDLKKQAKKPTQQQ